MVEPHTPYDVEQSAQPRDPSAEARAVAEYLGDMIGQMEGLARAQGFDLLVYLLSMARVEAETTARDMGSKRRSQG